MKLTILPRSGSRLYSVRYFSPEQYLLAIAIGITVMGAFLGAGYWLGVEYGHHGIVANWKHDIKSQQDQLEEVRLESDANLEALTQKIAYYQAHINRLDALGNKLLNMADLDDLEIDFTQPPGFGGPDSYADASNQDVLASMEQILATISSQLQSQENKLHTLDVMLTDRNLREEVYPQGRPIEKGWISSHYGKRADPFTGKQEYHRGVDFAGKYYSNVISVAGGVVTEADDRSGYGNLVEIDHGNGYVTRYGHNDKLSVKVGQTVKKGQVIAKMGSTGRSTGPHVHFEVLKNGARVDPMKFIRSKENK
ncbi:MAG: M23 family metallopeptidase [Gammaproteobacteria bacterium]|nr:M23 family metallopeptidase [Gammaproteobacteria bacterium]